MRLIALDPKTGKEAGYELRSRVTTFALDEQGRLREVATSTGLRIECDGRNVIVTDCGLPQPLRLIDLDLPPQTPHVWAAGQEIHLGRYLLLVDRTAPFAPGIVLRPPLERIAPFGVGLLVVLGVLLVGRWFWRVEGAALNLVRQMAQTDRPTPQPTPRSAPDPVPPLQPVAIRPTSTPTLRPTITPTLVITGTINAGDIYRTPTPTFTATLTSSLALAQVTPTPLPTSAATPQVWDPRLDRATPNLGVAFTPAQVAVGGQFYQLVEAQWLDERESNGYHHIFIDVVDESNQRLAGVYTIAKWSTGSCRRQIGPKPPILIKETLYIEYGADCPMFTAGSAYTVTVEGLPSDSIGNLGLGSPEYRTWDLLTSFRLKFQRTTNPGAVSRKP